jgi:hypothetical protein
VQIVLEYLLFNKNQPKRYDLSSSADTPSDINTRWLIQSAEYDNCVMRLMLQENTTWTKCFRLCIYTGEEEQIESVDQGSLTRSFYTSWNNLGVETPKIQTMTWSIVISFLSTRHGFILASLFNQLFKVSNNLLNSEIIVVIRFKWTFLQWNRWDRTTLQ